MSFFDTLLRLTPVRLEDSEAGVARVIDYLQEHRRLKLYDAESDRGAYAAARRKLETTAEPSEADLKNRYAWMRMEGTILLGGNRHGITGMLFPSGPGRATFAVHFSVPVYQELYVGKPVYQGDIDEEMARDLVGLSQTIAGIFGADGFLYTTQPDLLTPVPTESLTAFMPGEDLALMDEKTIMFAGIRESLVTLQVAAKFWKKENLTRSTSGYVVLNLFLPYELP